MTGTYDLGWILGIVMAAIVIVCVLGAFAAKKKLQWDEN